MSFANVNELSNHEFGVLCPSILNTQRKMQKTKILPNMSPKEHRLFVQKPSLNKNYSKPKETLSIFKEIIERSLGKARESTPSVPSQRKHLKKRIKYCLNLKKIDNNEKQARFTLFRRFMANKPIKNKCQRSKSPVLSEQSLVVTRYNSKMKLMINRKIENSNITRRLTADSESDEDRMDKLEIDYL